MSAPAAFLETISACCDPEGVLTATDAMAPYLTDWRGVSTGRAFAVVRPRDVSEVSAVVRVCAQAGVAMVPQGGNTGLAAGATPVGLDRAIVISLARMRSVRAVDATGMTISLDAGFVLSDVHARAEEAGLFFPVSLASEGSAQIGGLIATNAGGTAVLRYGSMRAQVLGIEAVLADGSIVDGMRALPKDNAGYDWKQLFIGSEGTLGVITGAVLRLYQPPRSIATALVSTRSVDDAVHVFSRARSAYGELLSAAEIFPDRAVALRIEHTPGLARPLPGQPWYALLEISAPLRGLEDSFRAAFEELADSQVVVDVAMAQSSVQRRSLWAWRETISESEKRAGPSVKHDVAVPVAALGAFVNEATAAVEARWPACRVLAFGHAGDGNVHFNVLLPNDGSVNATDVNTVVHAIVAAYRGSITAEHGIGRYRRAELAAFRSPSELRLLRALKTSLDPRDLMNPGAVL